MTERTAGRRATEWRLLRGWDERELGERLDALNGVPRNFDGDHDAHMADPKWNHYGSHATVWPPGPGVKDGDDAWGRGRRALETFAFSDPGIVEVHFEHGTPLAGQRMLLELKVLGLHYLCGVVVTEVRDEESGAGRAFGFRYDTLEGHLEAGSEWFLLEQERGSGTLVFSIEASWQPGNFPNLWSRWGFALFGRRYQRRWHEQAHVRMALLLGGGDPAALAASRGRRLARSGPEVVFTGGGRR